MRIKGKEVQDDKGTIAILVNDGLVYIDQKSSFGDGVDRICYSKKEFKEMFTEAERLDEVEE